MVLKETMIGLDQAQEYKFQITKSTYTIEVELDRYTSNSTTVKSPKLTL